MKKISGAASRAQFQRSRGKPEGMRHPSGGKRGGRWFRTGDIPARESRSAPDAAPGIL